MISRTVPWRYYKNDRTRSFANPTRRWLYQYIVLGSIALAGGSFLIAYQRAKWEARRYGDTRGDCLCGPGMVDLLTVMPFNRISNAVGRLAEPGILPNSVHQLVINFLVKFYKINLEEATKQKYESLQDFYVREWNPSARPLATASSVVAVSPCDGELLSIHDNVTETSITQVKGLKYGIHSLFRTSFGEVPAGRKRVAVVLHLRIGDFHHVISPASFNCAESIYVPGCLLPTTNAAWHWIPSVLTFNERLIVHGTVAGKNSTSVCALALVGSTLSGKMSLAFYERIRTNFLDPPEYALHTPYMSRPVLPLGSRIGTFFWGSSVVLLLDVPQEAQFTVRPGETVKVGEALVTLA